MPDTVQTQLKSLCVLIPVYNSESTLYPLVERVMETLTPAYPTVQIVLVNDGSMDQSHREALRCRARFPESVTYVRLARNFGEHNAVLCGLHHVRCDAVAIIDDDLQNPPSEILVLAKCLEEGGYDVVYSKYAEKHHHWFRNLGSKFNDYVATIMLRKPKGLYLSSFKVINKFLVDVVTEYEGPYPYLDGLVLRSTSSIGTQLVVHSPRAEGRSNYNFRRLVHLWLNMFTSFSVTPLRVSAYVGFLMALIGLGLGFVFFFSYVLEVHYFMTYVPPGWASIIVLLSVFSGIQLCMLGIMGEYLGRLYLSNNRQPQFVVREVFDNPPGGDSVPQ